MFRAATGDMEGMLRMICETVHAYGGIEVGRESAA
jgi:hypothetical protein